MVSSCPRMFLLSYHGRLDGAGNGAAEFRWAYSAATEAARGQTQGSAPTGVAAGVSNAGRPDRCSGDVPIVAASRRRRRRRYRRRRSGGTSPETAPRAVSTGGVDADAAVGGVRWWRRRRRWRGRQSRHAAGNLLAHDHGNFRWGEQNYYPEPDGELAGGWGHPILDLRLGIDSVCSPQSMILRSLQLTTDD
jgi:hypothetical protein